MAQKKQPPQPSPELLDKFIADMKDCTIEAAKTLPGWERVNYLRQWQLTQQALEMQPEENELDENSEENDAEIDPDLPAWQRVDESRRRQSQKLESQDNDSCET